MDVAATYKIANAREMNIKNILIRYKIDTQALIWQPQQTDVQCGDRTTGVEKNRRNSLQNPIG
jgi:hypothetical protein